MSLGASYKREKVMNCDKPQLFTMPSFLQTTVRYQQADRTLPIMTSHTVFLATEVYQGR
jgi:hypothetical protein